MSSVDIHELIIVYTVYMYVCVGAPGCSPADTPGQSSQFSAGQFGPERPAAPESGGRCGSSEHPSVAVVSLAVKEKQV